MEASPTNTGYSISRTLGTASRRTCDYIGKHMCSFIAAICVVLVLIAGWLIYKQYQSSDDSIFDAASKCAMKAYHVMCEGKGGCGLSCPYISPNDPRVVINTQIDMATTTLRQMQGALGENDGFIQSLFNKAPKVSKDIVDSAKTESALIIKNATIWTGYVGQLVTHMQSMSQGIFEEKTITSDIVNRSNAVQGISALIDAYNNAFVVAIVHSHSVVMNKLLNSGLSKDDAIMSDAGGHFRSLEALYNAIAQNVPSDGVVKTQTNLIKRDSLAADVTQAMVDSKNMVISYREYMTKSLTFYAALMEIYEKSFGGKKDDFNNDLPITASDKINALVEAGDWNSAIIGFALEPEIVANHKKFSKERASFDAGGGVPSVRDDANDLIPWVGLSRPTNLKSDGVSFPEKSHMPLTSIISEEPESMVSRSKFRYSFS